MAFLRGAKKSPRHKLLASIPFRMTAAPPPQFAVVPTQLSVWGNSTYGDCVSAEEAFAKAAWSIQCGLPELFVSEAEVVRWAGDHGFLNGADLSEVMDAMARDGMNVGGTKYTDGGYNGVDYSNETILQAALVTGPVKIAIDADALPSGAGNQQGWFTTNNRNYGNTDHCVGLCGYGAAAYLYQQLGVPVPAGLDASAFGYLLFTWSTIGFVTHAWLMGTCTEAWVRNPTTPGQSPVPAPTPTPSPTPVPSDWLARLIAFIKFLESLLFSRHSEVEAVFAKRLIAPQAIPSWIIRIINDLMSAVPKLLPIVQAGIAAGKTWAQILDDCLTALGV